MTGMSTVIKEAYGQASVYNYNSALRRLINGGGFQVQCQPDIYLISKLNK
jgi:hypothetical protein